jgi:hypothetical protein
MWETIWGVKTVAIFDVWSIEHLLSGISVGSFVIVQNRKKLQGLLDHSPIHRRMDYFFLLFLAYAWETLEHYLEVGLWGDKVEYWFQGVEFWANRLISDPLLLVIGYWVAKRYVHAVTPARLLSMVWLLVHLFVFPHSMYLHELF